MAPACMRCAVDGFAREIMAREGIDIREVEPFSILLVQTMNSLYRIITLEAGRSRIMVQGGQCFPDFVEAHLNIHMEPAADPAPFHRAPPPKPEPAHRRRTRCIAVPLCELDSASVSRWAASSRWAA